MDLEKIGHGWKIEKELGEGSFGKVYKIVREEYGYKYESALKVIHIPQSSAEINIIKNEGMTDESVTTYFKSVVEDIIKEFVLMSRLKGNTNIVSYEDHVVVPLENTIGWEIYIRMELLTPLFDYINNSTFTLKDAVQLGIDMCQALEICEQYNIIHRDIKPENIFVSNLGNYKLGDFGIARQLEKTTSGMSKKGTYNYMAPEVYRGLNYDKTVDIYSLGIVLYRFLNDNRTPFLPNYPDVIYFSDRENANIMRLSGKEMPLPHNADEKLGNIILKACAYNSKDRYQSAKELKKELQKYMLSINTSNNIPLINRIENNVSSNSSNTNKINKEESYTQVLILPTQEELEAHKINTLNSINEYINLNNYYDNEKVMINNIIQQYTKRINEAIYTNDIDNYYKQGCLELNNIKTKQDYQNEKEELINNRKKLVKDNIRKYKDVNEYNPNEIIYIEQVIDQYINIIDQDKELEDINTHFEELKLVLDKVKTSKQIQIEEENRIKAEKIEALNREKIKCIDEIKSYKDASLFYDNELIQYQEIISSYSNKIDTSFDLSTIKQYVDESKQKIDNLKTKEDYQKEEQQKLIELKSIELKNQKIKAIDELKQHNDSSYYYEKELLDISNILDKYKILIEKEDNVSKISKYVIKAKKELDNVNTIQYYQNQKKKIEKKQQNKKDFQNVIKGKKFKISVVAIILFLCIASGVYFYNLSTYTTVPNLVNSSLSDAKTMIKNKELSIKVTEINDDTKKGYVISQDISEGEKVKKDTVINIKVSLGPAIEVPNLINISKEDAANKLKELGLNFEIEKEIYSTKVKKNYIISQNPNNKVSLNQGDTVSVVVSKGVEQVVVPELVGLTESEAKEELNKVSLKYTVNESYSDSVSEGKIISQDKKSGSKVDKNSSIVLNISKGKKPEEKSTTTEKKSTTTKKKTTTKKQESNDEVEIPIAW
jgi:beta-lactam-binding protein with PASTA domain